MSETSTEQIVEQPQGGEPAKPQSLEELLADLDDERRQVILGQVGKARDEAKNLRERLKKAEPLAQQFAALEQASKTDQQRADEARRALEERASTAMQRLARAEVKAALAGVVDNADAIVDDLNLAKFVTDDGEVDSAAVQALRAKYAGFGGPRAPRPDASQASAANGGSASSPAQDFASFLQAQIRK